MEKKLIEFSGGSATEDFFLNKMAHVVNPGPEDYHLHSFTFSDGLMTLEEIVHHAGKIGLQKIAITDHSQASIEKRKLAKKTDRDLYKRWKNGQNDVEVIFGVEGDILDKDGRICRDIQGVDSNFLVLSAHDYIYESEPRTITEAYLRAMERHHQVINLLGHPCSAYFKQVDIDMVVTAANHWNIPLELNCANLVGGRTDLDKLQRMLQLADRVYVNSDAHTLHELGTLREKGFAYLKEQEFIH